MHEQLKISSPLFDEEELTLLRECLDSKWVTQGPMTSRFEALVSQYQSATYALATTSCTAALHLAMLALGLGPEDEVIVPAFTWVTSASCAEYVGASVKFVDIDPLTYNIDPQRLVEAIGPRTRAIVAVHLFGLAAPMNEVLAIAGKNELWVIEDAACAMGTTYKGKPVGALGDVGCFSFHPRKVITTGEGGIVTTNSEEIRDKVASYRNHGSTGVLDDEPTGPWTMASFDRLGFNLRMSDIQAAVGIAQMHKLENLLQERREFATDYSYLLADIEEIIHPDVMASQLGHSFQTYVIQLKKGGRTRRNAIMTRLAERGIQTRPGTHAVHKLGYYKRKYELYEDDFPIASCAENATISLPLFPSMTVDQRKYIVESIKDALVNEPS